jgi:hypothetical protein
MERKFRQKENQRIGGIGRTTAGTIMGGPTRSASLRPLTNVIRRLADRIVGAGSDLAEHLFPTVLGQGAGHPFADWWSKSHHNSRRSQDQRGLLAVRRGSQTIQVDRHIGQHLLPGPLPGIELALPLLAGQLDLFAFLVNFLVGLQ